MEAKPVSLLEEERQFLALETRQADQRCSALDILQSLPSTPPPPGAESSSSSHRGDLSRRDRDQDWDKECDCDRDLAEPMAERDQEKKELEAVKEQSLVPKKPKRVIKPSEKFRVSFDWDQEYTSQT